MQETRIAELASKGDRRPGQTWHVPRANLPKEVNAALERLKEIPEEEIEAEFLRMGIEPVKGGTHLDALAGLLVGTALAMTSPRVEPTLEPLQWAVRLGGAVRSKMTTIEATKRRERERKEKEKAKRRKKRKETGR